MEDHQYGNGMADLRQFMDNGRSTGVFTAIAQPVELHQNQLSQAQAQHSLEMLMTGAQASEQITMPHHLHQFQTDSTTTGTFTANLTGGLDMDTAGFGGGGDGGAGRWPRQETLTLLEIRSRLDYKFKEAIQKGPLWDEVSRIMSEEHGYQRSGKKCREKFENLYKYYKKTKDGKAGRQDGKHYRFFRQLEALYGETSNPTAVSESHLIGNSTFQYNAASDNATRPNQEAFHRLSDSLSPSNSSAFNSSSSDNDNDSMEKRRKRRGKRSWRAKIKDFIDEQMRKLMEKQEAWLEKMMKTIEHKEQQRMLREEEWRKQETARIDREHKFWMKERAWIEARDAGLMETLQKLTAGNDQLKNISSSPEVRMRNELQNISENQNDNGSETITNCMVNIDSWPESEITRLVQLRTSMESRFQQSGCSEEVLWEEIATKMAFLGYDRSGLMCKDKWDSINNNYLMKTKKRKENCFYFESTCNQGGGGLDHHINVSPPNSSANAAAGTTNIHGSSFRYFMGDADNLWENYGLKLSKGDN